MTKYTVSLTTIPSRFDTLYLTIDSIIEQTVKPDKIIINIPKIYGFRFNNTSIPLVKINEFIEKYSKYNIIVNIIDRDYGPGTKLLGLLNSDLIKQDEFIILLDDDVIYKPYLIEYFNNYIQLNKSVEVASYYVYDSHIRIGQGVDGFFIKSNILKMFSEYYNIIKDYDYINYHDDYYISYYFHLLNKYIHYIIPPFNSLIYTKQSNTSDCLLDITGKYSRQLLNIEVYMILNRCKNNNNFLHIKE